MGVKIICVVNDTALHGTNLRSEHGLSICIETDNGIVLYDTGQTEEVLVQNFSILNLKPQDISQIVLSHAHYDHTGGLEAILRENPECPIFAHNDIFRPRFSLKNGKYQSIGLSEKLKERLLASNLNLSEKPVQILPDLWTTGEIVARSEPEGRSANHFISGKQGWLPDSYRDDLSLVVRSKEKLYVICGCCHAGLLNTLFHVAQNFNGPIVSVIGGTHLLTADGLYLAHVMDVINEQFTPLEFYLNHCTGVHAYQIMEKTFGERVRLFPAGTVIDFDG